ncbi:polymorphic toxin type 15 domain-containing protein [Mesorhizobium sp. SB112]|uniref:polymorphic toxin type 15 domain-containing protein n=1 Tax=Mesorhizobium sp. SB112 TaxID=3151853 RepID=UPI003267F8D9
MVAIAYPIAIGLGRGAVWGWRAWRAYRTAKALEAAAQAADALAQANQQAEELDDSQARDETCDGCATQVPCFDLPPGMDREEFARQLKEQQDTINNMTADEMAYAHWVLEKAGTTRLVRDQGAQRQARNNYRRMLERQNKSDAEIEAIMNSVNATHFLDIVAGGDPSRVGIGGADANQEIGRQWIRDNRTQTLRDAAEKMRQEGRAGEKMNVELSIC